MKYVIRLFAVIGAIVILLAITAAVVAFVSRTTLPEKIILEINLEEGLVEYVPDNPLADLMLGKKPRLHEIVESLERAASDDRVVGVIAQIGHAPIGLAQVQELRESIQAFRRKGKPTLAFSETFGEMAPGTSSYYLATAFDQIVMQPSGDVGLVGLMAASPFIHDTLDKLDITPRLDHRSEYKNAMNMFTEKKFTEPHREALEKLLGSWFGQIVRGVSEGRRIPEAEVKSLVDRGPFLGQEAVTAKLVDRLGYRDEAITQIKQKAGDAKLVRLTKYISAVGEEEEGAAIALIHGVGPVSRGDSKMDAPSGTVTMGASTVAGAIRAATQDSDVKAILFRIDSPGGSYVASDTIWREVQAARKAGKPVVVSMANVAASGGYFVAAPADKIVAQPATITGSIGVLGGKAITVKAWEKIGVTWDEVHIGANADIFSTLKDYSPQQWVRFQSWLDRVYEDFTNKVAEGRKLPKEKVMQLAKGRVWSGEDAKALGLVDELGGYSVAIKLAKDAAKIPAAEKIVLKPFPRPKSPWQRLLQADSDGGQGEARLVSQVFELVQPAVKLGRQLGMIDQPRGVLSMPDLGEIQ